VPSIDRNKKLFDYFFFYSAIVTPFPIKSQEPMNTHVTSVYRAPADTLTNYDFVIELELRNTNIIVIYSAKKRTCAHGPI